MTAVILAAAMLISPAQKPNIDVPVLTAPTKASAKPTPEEMTTLRGGLAFLQQKKYDEAIAEYQKVLTANPASSVAMYEIAEALVEKGDPAAAVAMALRSVEYNDPDLAKSYSLIGSVFDMMGEPKKAVETYDRAIALAPPSPGTLYYNKAITQLQSLNDTKGAIATLKEGAVADPLHASTQLMLGKYFLSGDMQTPAFMAFSRFLISEPGSRRTGEGFQPWYGLLTKGMKVGADGKGQISVNPNKSKDEGDLTQMDLYFALSQATAAAMPEDTPPGERLTAQISNLIGVWTTTDAKTDGKKFLSTYYLPYFKEMREKKLVQPFVYYVCQNVGLPGAREWIAAHRADVQAFLEWNTAFVFK